MQIPEAATVGVLRKKFFLKILQNLQENLVPGETSMNFAKFLRTPFLKKLLLYGPFLKMGFNCLKARATSRRQFTFYH